MEMIFCPNCNKLTGYKRALGFGTFFAVVLTAGFWLLAIPFYPKRCMTCGFTKSDSVPWYRTWRLALLIGGVVFVIGVVMEQWFPSKASRPAASAPTSETGEKSSNTALPSRHGALGHIVPVGAEGNVNGPPPLHITVVKVDTLGMTNGGYMLFASVRFSDDSLKAFQKADIPPDMDKFRFNLVCGGSRPGCVALQVGDSYWLQFIHPGDTGYYTDRVQSKDCQLARFGRELGKEATALYYACMGNSRGARK